MKPTIELLVVGTSPTRRERVAKGLEGRGYQLHTAANLSDARTCIVATPAKQLVVLSLQANPQALALLEPVHGAPRFPLLILLARNDTPATVRALKAGAIEVLVESPATLRNLPKIIESTRMEWKKRRAEQQAIDHAARFGHILASSMTEIYTFDAATLHYLRVNHRAIKNIGYSMRELRKLTPLNLYPLLSREEFEERLKPLRNGVKEALSFEAVHRRKDGSLYPVKVQLHHSQGDPLAFIAVVLDVSERKEVEENLQASEARFRSIFDIAAAGMAILTPYGEILDANPFFCEFCGYRADELIGRNIEEVTHPEDRETTADYYAALRQGKELIINIEKRYLRKDGQIRWGHGSIACVLRHDQSNAFCIGLVQDITRLKEAEAKMREANNELDAFVHTVAHDLRTPLTPIIGMAEYLRSHASQALDQTALNCLADIEKSGYRMLALLEDLLSLARVGHIRQPTTPVDTRRVVDEVLMNLSSPLAAARSNIQVEKLSPLCLPKTLLSQLFDNLIGNAVRYAGKTEKPIEIGEERQENRITLYVRDHGPGIPEQEREHIFEVFYRGETARQVSGTGVGLATVRKIARLYQGDVWVEATPGGGSTFRVGFPLATLSCAVDDNQNS